MNSSGRNRWAVGTFTVLAGAAFTLAGAAPAVAATAADESAAVGASATTDTASGWVHPQFEWKSKCDRVGRRGERENWWEDYRCRSAWVWEDRDDEDDDGRERRRVWVLWVKMDSDEDDY